MPRKKRDTSTEKLNTQIDINKLGTTGEEGALRDLAKVPQMTDLQATDFALVLQKIIRGEVSALAQENKAEVAAAIAQLRAEAAARDEANRKFQEDQKKFLEEVSEKAERIRASIKDRDKETAKGAAMMKNAMIEARAINATRQMELDAQIAAMPEEIVASPGVIVTGRIGPNPVTQVEPEIVKIGHRTWVLPVGEQVRVPKIVADVLRERRKGQKIDAQYKRALTSNLESKELNKRLSEIQKQFEGPHVELSDVPIVKAQ